MTRQCTMYLHTQSLAVVIKCSLCSYHQTLTRTPHEWLKKNAPRHMTHCQVISSWLRGDWWRQGAQSFGDRCSIPFVWWWTAGRENSAVVTYAGPWLLVELVCGDTQEERLWNFILRRGDVDDDGTSCHSNTTRNLHAERWLLNLDLPMQCAQSTISRQLKFGKTLRASAM